MNDDCPHTLRIGQHEARITALENGQKELKNSWEKEIHALTLTVEHNALKIIEDKASQSGFIKGVHATASLLGYSIIIVALLVAGKFTGAMEAVLKFFSVIK